MTLELEEKLARAAATPSVDRVLMAEAAEALKRQRLALEMIVVYTQGALSSGVLGGPRTVNPVGICSNCPHIQRCLRDGCACITYQKNGA
jgi:hypothetical protein